MLYIVAPFESENIVKGISSRNIELACHSKEDCTLIISLFDHRYKRFNDKKIVSENLKKINDKINLCTIKTLAYKNNVSIMRIVCNVIFSLSMFVVLVFRVGKNDSVLINSIPPEVVLLSTLASKIKGFRLIMDTRDIWPDALIKNRGFVTSLFKTYCNAIYRLAIKSTVNNQLYVAHSFLSWLEGKGFSGDQKFLPLGFDANRWNNKVVTDTSKFSKKLVYVGYLSMQFDLKKYLDFVRKNEDWELHIIGGGETLESTKDVYDFDRIVFYGMVSPNKVEQLVTDIRPDIAILPLSEGAKAYMPNKLFDYIALGVPIIVSGSSDAGRFVTENKFGWFVSNDNELYHTLSNIKLEDLNLIRSHFNTNRDKYSMQEMYAEWY